MKKWMLQAVRLLLVTLLVAQFGLAVACDEEEGCRKYTGIGLGVIREDDSRPMSVKQVVAIRAAKLEAVRSLVEQIFGINVASKSDMLTAQLINDRATLDSAANLKGVRFVKVEPLQPGIYQAVAEVEYVGKP